MVEWDEMVLVGRVARPHGIRGDVVVNPETDFADERFAVGASLWISVAGVVTEVTVARATVGSRRPIVGFEGASDISDAERLAGAELRVPEGALAKLEPGAYYVHQLVGCRVETIAGEPVGEVVRVEGGTGASVLAVAGPSGEVLIPLAVSVCPTIDVERRLVVVDAPEGLLEVNEPMRRKRRRAGRTKGTA
jgi:16S rRNA processing protein RimM